MRTGNAALFSNAYQLLLKAQWYGHCSQALRPRVALGWVTTREDRARLTWFVRRCGLESVTSRLYKYHADTDSKLIDHTFFRSFVFCGCVILFSCI